MKKFIGKTVVLVAIFMLVSTSASAKSYESFFHRFKEALLQACIEARSSTSRPVRLYQERKAVGRALLEVQLSNVDEVLPYYTDDIEYHDPIVDIYGIDEMTGFLYQLLGASPDLVTTIEDETLRGNVYSATWIMSGSFLGVPYEAKGISIFKFRPKTAQVYYQRDYYSEGDIMATIPGLNLAIGGFRDYYKCSVVPDFECPLELPPSAVESGIVFEEEHNPKRHKRLRSKVQLHRAQMKIGRQLVEINAGNYLDVLPYLRTTTSTTTLSSTSMALTRWPSF